MFLDYGLLLLRLVVGLTIAAHGAQKAFGWFGGSGPRGTMQMMERLNVHPRAFWAYTTAISEFLGGLFIAVGLLWPIGPVMLVADMIVAIVKVHWKNGFWNANRGYEFSLLMLVNAFVLGIMGPGAIALDAWFNFALPEPQTFTLGLIVAIVGASLAVLSSETIHVMDRRAGQHR